MEKLKFRFRVCPLGVAIPFAFPTKVHGARSDLSSYTFLLVIICDIDRRTTGRQGRQKREQASQPQTTHPLPPRSTASAVSLSGWKFPLAFSSAHQGPRPFSSTHQGPRLRCPPSSKAFAFPVSSCFFLFVPRSTLRFESVSFVFSRGRSCVPLSSFYPLVPATQGAQAEDPPRSGSLSQRITHIICSLSTICNLTREDPRARAWPWVAEHDLFTRTEYVGKFLCATTYSSKKRPTMRRTRVPKPSRLHRGIK